MNDVEIKKDLLYLIDGGMIDASQVHDYADMMRKKKYLDMHPYKISYIESIKKWYTYLPDDEKGRVQRKRNTREEIEDIVIKYWEEKLENPTVKEVFDEWNDRRVRLKKIKKATHLRYTQDFKRYYKEFGKRKIKSLEPEEIQEFLEEQIAEYDLTAKAFSELKTITRGFLKRAKKRKLISFNVEEIFQELDTSDSDFRKVIKEDFQEVFDEDEMPLMIEYLEKNLDIHNLAILLMFVTGIRIGETVALKHSDFDGYTFKIRRTETRYKENGEYVYDIDDYPKTQAGVRTVIIPRQYEWIANVIKRTNPFCEYIFMKDGERMHTQAIRLRQKRLCDKIKIYRKSPNKIRKTYGSILLDNHLDERLIIGQMGHTNVLCTEQHYHRNRKGIERKQEILSSIPEFQAKQ